MFVIESVTDVVKIQASDLCTGSNTIAVLHREIDAVYPDRVLTNVGLIIGRHGDTLKVGHGVCKHDSTHFTVSFSVIVFCPFVGEIITGQVVENSPEGLVVSTGFFGAIHVPAYWMLNPSVYENDTWVWVPEYEEEEEDDDDEKARYEMYVGAEVRVRVKSIHYTTVTATAKGVQAVTVTQEQSGPERRRSSSVGLDETERTPSAMHIVASICEDGLGLTAWWKDNGEEEEEEEEAAEVVEE